MGGRGEREFAASFIGPGRSVTIQESHGATYEIEDAAEQMPPMDFKVVGVELKDQPYATDEELQKLAGARLPHLESIVLLKQPQLSPTGLQYLADAYPRLKFLNLSGMTGVKKDRQGGLNAADLLPVVQQFGQLDRIVIDSKWGEKEETTAWADGLADMKSLRHVEFQQFVTGEAMTNLSKHGGIETLVLATPAVSDETLAHAPEITSVRHLKIHGFALALTSAGVKHLEQMEGLETLSFAYGYQDNRYMNFTRDDLRAVAAALPNCRVTFFEDGKHVTISADAPGSPSADN